VKRVLLIFLMGLWALTLLGTGEGITITKKMGIVILPGKVGQGWNMGEVNHLIAILEEKALELGRFRVYPREDLKKILEEQKLAMAGITDESAISLSKIAGAQYALLLTLTHLEAQYNKDYDGYTATARMSIKLYDVGNGELLAAERFERQTFFPADTYDEAISEVINYLADDILVTLREFFKLEARVAVTRGNRVYLVGLDPKLVKKGYIFEVENEFGETGYLKVIDYDRKRGYVIAEHMYGVFPEIGASVKEYPMYPYKGALGVGMYQGAVSFSVSGWGTVEGLPLNLFVNAGVFLAQFGEYVPFYSTLGLHLPVLTFGRIQMALLSGLSVVGIVNVETEESLHAFGLGVGVSSEYQFTPKSGLYIEVFQHFFPNPISVISPSFFNVTVGISLSL